MLPYRLVSLKANKTYKISYYYKSAAESGYNYARFYLTPKNTIVTAGSSFITSSGAPNGCISLDAGSEINDVWDWTYFEKDFMVTADDSYMLLLCWRNDGSVGDNPPLNIDDISITRLECPTPPRYAYSIRGHAA